MDLLGYGFVSARDGAVEIAAVVSFWGDLSDIGVGSLGLHPGKDFGLGCGQGWLRLCGFRRLCKL